ncbi:MAG: hypothetical protein HYX27_09885 [Acidobacteria bacterium]|nr:hypothetical protein [Acidobacteriota bacterium]
MVLTRVPVLGLLAVLTATGAIAQPRYFIGAGPGISILSGGSGSQVTASAAAISNYEPKAGAEAHVFGGWHPWEYLSVQAAWSASRNGLTFNATTPNGFYRQQRKSSQQNVGADALLYFRERKSPVRPFLSVGLNHMWFSSDPTSTTASGGALLPPPRYTGRAWGLRVAAGADLVRRNGWGFRYAFMEHLQQRNVIGLRLEPAARRQLMTFQHIFGIVKYF